jgi:hypothetical protein
MRWGNFREWVEHLQEENIISESDYLGRCPMCALDGISNIAEHLAQHLLLLAYYGINHDYLY